MIVSRGVAPGEGWTPVELVTTVLSALAVLITVFGIFIAVLAVWGYARLAEDARNAAEAMTATIDKTPTEVIADFTRAAPWMCIGWRAH